MSRGGREGEAEKEKEYVWSNSTALRHKRESRRGSCCVSSLVRFEQVERAPATEAERERERECRSEGAREEGSLPFHLKITLSYTSLTLSAERSSEEGAELIRRCHLSAQGLSWTSLQRHHPLLERNRHRHVRERLK